MCSLFKTLPVFALALGGCAHRCGDAAPANALGRASQGMVVARIGDQTLTLADVDHAAGSELFELRQQTLEKLVSERVVELAAKRAGKSPSAFLEERLAARAPASTEAEAREFYQQNKERFARELGDRKFEDVKELLLRGLDEQKRREVLAEELESLRAKAGVKLLLQAPKVEIAATGPSRGPGDAKVTIVEFSDFECPFCSKGRKVMDQVVAAYGASVRLVFRDFPLPFHDHAQKAAEAGHCAEEQGRFWPMHDWMFDHQSALAAADLKAAAKTLGLDAGRFDACLETGKYGGAVGENQRAGEKVGVKGTPAFFINGILLSGAQPFEQFKSEIDRALGR